MFTDQSLLSRISLDHPGIQVGPDKAEHKAIKHLIQKLFSGIKIRLDKLIPYQKFPFDKSDIKINYKETFPGANAISITNRSAKDKTSLSYLEKHRKDYLFCVKSDGTRYLWVVLEDGRQFFVARNNEIFRAKVELSPFFFRKRKQELLVYQRAIREIPLADRFTTPKVKISKRGGFESENHRIGRLDGLFQKSDRNHLVQAVVDTSDWKLSDMLLTQEQESLQSQDASKMMRFKKLYQVNEELFRNVLNNTGKLFEGVETQQQKFEEWVLRKEDNTDSEKKAHARFVFDGELILNENQEWEYLLFDTLVYNRELVIDKSYFERLSFCQVFSGKSQFYEGFFSRAKNPHQFINRLRSASGNGTKRTKRDTAPPENIIARNQPKLTFTNQNIQEIDDKSDPDSLFSDDKEEEEATHEFQMQTNGSKKKQESAASDKIDEPEQGEVQQILATPVRPGHLKKRDFEEFQSSALEKTILQPPLALLPIKLKTKDFYNFRSVDFLLDTVCETVPFKDNNDGIIITRNNYPYIPGKTNGILKWKPDSLNSIDFLVVENPTPLKKTGQAEGCLFELYVVRYKALFLFDYMFASPEEAQKIRAQFREYTIGGLDVRGAILEMVYNKQKSTSVQGKL